MGERWRGWSRGRRNVSGKDVLSVGALSGASEGEGKVEEVVWEGLRNGETTDNFEEGGEVMADGL